IDFSDCSYEALNSAAELASHFTAELCVAHIVPDIPRPIRILPPADKMEVYEQGLSEYEEALNISAQQKLHDAIKQFVPDGLRSRAIVGQGDAAYEVVRIADEEEVDLIVLATHSLSDWREVAHTSVAEGVVRL